MKHFGIFILFFLFNVCFQGPQLRRQFSPFASRADNRKDPSSIVCDPSIEKCSGGTNTTDTTGLAGTSLSSSSGGIGSSIGCFPTECKHWKNKRKCCTININGQCDYKDCRDLYWWRIEKKYIWVMSYEL